MAYLIIRHQVEDYARWRPQFDAHQAKRDAAGLTDLYLWHGVDDDNWIVLMFAAADPEKARRFINSTDLKETMQRAGVRGEAEFEILTGQESLQPRERAGVGAPA